MFGARVSMQSHSEHPQTHPEPTETPAPEEELEPEGFQDLLKEADREKEKRLM